MVDDLFDRKNILAQRERLIAERNRIENAIGAIDLYLSAMGSDENTAYSLMKPTLTNAVRKICHELETKITRTRVMKELESRFPQIDASDSSVAAILSTMASSAPRTLYVEIKGSGRRAAEYGISEPRRFQLNATEAKILLHPDRTVGTGGWQSLFKKLQNNYDRDTKELTFPDSLKTQIYSYLIRYGAGGYQSHLKKILVRHVPEIFQ